MTLSSQTRRAVMGAAVHTRRGDMQGITSLGHVAIRVKDIDRSLDFYVNKMGFEEMFRLDKDGALWIVYLRVTDDQYVELFPGGEGDRSPATEAVGYNHVCFTVDDIDAVIARLESRGVQLSRPKKVAVDRNAQAWVEDPDGNRVELMQMLPGCLHFEAIERLKARR
jgi:lactoylglutathione lyase